jgi:hypothetical protein
MERTSTSAPGNPGTSHPKRSPRRRPRPDGDAAREAAFANLGVWRHYLIREVQHLALNHLLTHGEMTVVDLDSFVVPVAIRRVFIGAALAELSRHRLIRKASASPIYVTTNGRHGYYVQNWRLNADAAGVREWKRSHPVPPAPETEEHDS